MNVKYFRDTDTALLEFSDAFANETREISENVYVDLDKDGNLVSTTRSACDCASTRNGPIRATIDATSAAIDRRLIGFDVHSVRLPLALAIIACLNATTGHAQLCRPDSLAQAARVARPANYIFFREDRARIAEPGFLSNDRIVGAQLTFTWRELEPARDRYDFTALRERYTFLARHGKRLVVQLQENSFSERQLVPEYLLTDTAFHGGAARKFEGDDEASARFDGWVARRWDPAVRARFAKLLDALGREFDGRIEALVIPETAIGMNIPSRFPSGFSFDSYALGMQEITSAARRAFTRSCTIIYANFMPGEWLPGNDNGYLRGMYAHAERIGAGVGGPDVLPHRRGQRNHSYPLIAARRPGVVGGLAVQDGNLAEIDPATHAPVTVNALYRFARDTLRLDFVFWGTEEPYYTRDILPYLRRVR
jgi:hypothetical protein